MSDGLIEDEFANRPENDELAFVYYEKLFRIPLEKAISDIEADNRQTYNNSYNHFMQSYINNVLASVRALDLDILGQWVNSPQHANDEKNFRQIKFDIDGAVTQIKVRHAQISRKGSVRLEGSTREKIRDLINKIKVTIESITLPIPRKESLMSKLNAFAAEVDKDRTKFEAFGALIIDAAGVAGKAEQKLRPIRKWIDSIANVMHEATAFENTQARLIAPSKRIDPPVKQISAPSKGLWGTTPPDSKNDLDDEIPF